MGFNILARDFAIHKHYLELTALLQIFEQGNSLRFTPSQLEVDTLEPFLDHNFDHLTLSKIKSLT
jgi:hypothetical protein